MANIADEDNNSENTTFFNWITGSGEDGGINAF